LGGCMSGGSKMLWGSGELGEAEKRAEVKADSRPVLDVPPVLRGEVSVPKSDAIAVKRSMPERYKKIVAGKKVALDARTYEEPVAKVFSAVVDAMTGLSFPVQSVDSASGTLTTDWIRIDANNPSMMGIFNAFGGGGGPVAQRHRFVTRVLREVDEVGVSKARLEVRTLGQVYQNNHWVNKKMRRKLADDLFSRVEELLAQ
ncbi:MAG: hypothetical protein R8K49_09035, partial [Mariprofundaceae bacterium]